MSDAFRKEHADLFGGARKEAAPAAMKARVLAQAAPTATGSALSGSVKTLLVAGAAIVGLGAWFAMNARTSAPDLPKEPPAIVSTVSAVAPSVQATFTSAEPADPPPTVVASAKPPPAPAANASAAAPEEDSLGAEATLLGEAKRALAAGDLAAAGTALRSYGRRFPHGALAEEAEALRIEVDLRLGRQQPAKRALEAFERAHPTSPAIARLKRLVSSSAE